MGKFKPARACLENRATALPKDLHKALALFHELQDGSQTTIHLPEIVESAYRGRVKILFVTL